VNNVLAKKENANTICCDDERTGTQKIAIAAAAAPILDLFIG
jgi:hypothetical protein